MVNQQHVVADDIYSVLLFPLYAVWFFVPSGLRTRITAVPRETLIFMLKIIWTLAAYYWLFTIISPFLIIPECVVRWYDAIMLYQITLRESFWVWYSNVTITPFTVFFPSFSFMTWLVSKIQRKPVEQNFLGKCKNMFYVPERAVQGSELIPSKELPTFCCFIFGIKDDEERMVGCGFRVENAIFTAAHNLTGYDQIAIVSNTAKCIIDCDKATIFPYDDFAYFLLSDRDFSMLGMSKGKLLDHAVPKAYPMICQIYGPGTPVSFTMGAVVPIENFGKVTYGGSTTYGFSGGPYIQNKTIVGMHLGAGMVNLGLDAAYMHMLVSIKQESTEDWLMDMIEEDQLNKRAVSWERSPMDPDEVYVKRQGKYFTIDADTFFSIYKPHAYVSESFTPLDKLPTFTYSDSKNDVMAPAPVNAGAGASGSMSVIRNCVQTPLTADSYPTPTSIKDLEETLATEPREQTPVLRNNPSNFISKDTTYQPERNRRRVQQKQKKHAKSSRRSTSPGQPGLEMIR
uniref:Serine protease n=1 Tax=Riboviria sp. TaxID=2585031 RepID=A0A8K1U4Q0_9VIRU|nr:MAG: hypothetical protein [Riboviria sp.]